MKLPVLSHTFLDNYRNCPRKAWHKYVAKDLPAEAPSPEMQHGIVVHASFERCLRGNDPDNAPDAEMARSVLAMDGIRHFEWAVAIAETGTPVDYWSTAAWLRGKVDVAVVRPGDGLALILDWKTGKEREDPAELNTFALMLQWHYPAVKAIAGSYVWLPKESLMGSRSAYATPAKLGVLHELSDTARTMAQIKIVWQELQSLPIDKEWKPTPNPLCGWCPVRKCEFWKERK